MSEKIVFTARISKSGRQYFINIPSDQVPLVKPYHEKKQRLKVTLEPIED